MICYICHYVAKYLTLTNISPELKISCTVLLSGRPTTRISVFIVLHSKDDKVKVHYTVWLQGCNLYIAITYRCIAVTHS